MAMASAEGFQLPLSEVRVKEEQVAEYDGSYECLICSESVRGTSSLKCTQCQSNPVIHMYVTDAGTLTHLCLYRLRAWRRRTSCACDRRVCARAVPSGVCGRIALCAVVPVMPAADGCGMGRQDRRSGGR
jgi:hypothetical protein